MIIWIIWSILGLLIILSISFILVAHGSLKVHEDGTYKRIINRCYQEWDEALKANPDLPIEEYRKHRARSTELHRPIEDMGLWDNYRFNFFYAIGMKKKAFSYLPNSELFMDLIDAK